MVCVTNKAKYGTKTVRIKFHPSENANYFCPVTPVPTSVNGTYEKDTLVLVKIDPYEPWGDFSFEPIFEEPERASPVRVAEPEPAPVQGEQGGVTGDIGGATDFPPLDGETNNAGGVSCPACTFLNFEGAKTCEICQSAL